MFDECFSPNGAAVLKQFLDLWDPPVDTTYLVDFLNGVRGMADEDWGRLLCDTDYVVVSRDRGRQRQQQAKGMPLNLVLPKLKVTGVFMSGGLATASCFEMVRAVVCVLPDIIKECPRATKGTRYKVRAESGVYRLEEWEFKKGEMSPYV